MYKIYYYVDHLEQLYKATKKDFMQNAYRLLKMRNSISLIATFMENRN